MIKVRILHNVAESHFRGYSAGDALVPVFEVEWNGGDVGAHSLAEHMFELFNADPEWFGPNSVGGEIAAAYRARQLRSLSVGDVVRVGDDVLACDRMGFTVIDPPANVLTAWHEDAVTVILPAA